ncbi:MAG: hypothetical protein AUF79_14005 [Crenarchaeota archaeon 13_1_20CM_2_51_8]|nr:MAG: hypothetical protein AUF79_14005 [Crenarchaeota archaeon 13_1_20CM_2_51_8]
MTRSTIKHMNSRNKEGKGGYASVNGLNMYYEVHGAGRPPLFDDRGVPRRADAGGQVIGLQTKRRNQFERARARDDCPRRASFWHLQ